MARILAFMILKLPKALPEWLAGPAPKLVARVVFQIKRQGHRQGSLYVLTLSEQVQWVQRWQGALRCSAMLCATEARHKRRSSGLRGARFVCAVRWPHTFKCHEDDEAPGHHIDYDEAWPGSTSTLCTECAASICIMQYLQPHTHAMCTHCKYIQYIQYYVYGIRKYIYNRRKFRSQTSDNMERWKAEQGRGREKRKIRREKIRRERVRRQKIQMREKVGKSRNTVFFQWFVAPEGRKVGSLKLRVRSQLATGAMKNCTPLWREAHFEVKSVKNWRSRTTFGSWDVKKVHAVVARSTFPSQNVQNTPGSDHFWKLRCRKSARRCGAKHISKSKCTKHTRFGPLLEVAMSKKCTPLWREAHFEVKMYKTHHARTTFGGSDVEKVHAVVARSTFPS